MDQTEVMDQTEMMIQMKNEDATILRNYFGDGWHMHISRDGGEGKVIELQHSDGRSILYYAEGSTRIPAGYMSRSDSRVTYDYATTKAHCEYLASRWDTLRQFDVSQVAEAAEAEFIKIMLDQMTQHLGAEWIASWIAEQSA